MLSTTILLLLLLAATAAATVLYSSLVEVGILQQSVLASQDWSSFEGVTKYPSGGLCLETCLAYFSNFQLTTSEDV